MLEDNKAGSEDEEDEKSIDGSKDVAALNWKSKRGKKAQSLEQYKTHVQGKIDELVRLIKDPNTSLEDRKKYRN